MPQTVHRADVLSAGISGGPDVERPRHPLSIQELRHPRERSRLVLAVVPTVSVLLMVIIGVIATAGVGKLALGAAGVLVAVASVWITLQVARARMLGGAVRVSEHSFPQIQAVIDELCHELDYRGRLEVWIVEKGGSPIALTSYLGTKMILIEGGLASDLLAKERQPQLKFLIARFIGALRAKHLRLTLLQVVIGALSSLKFLNVFITPYERAIVFSGDQIGVACVGELSAGLGAINRLLVGKDMAPELAARGVLDQAHDVRRKVLPRLAQLFSKQPHLTNRYLNLLRFGETFDRADYERTVAGLDPQSREELASRKAISAGWLAPTLVGIGSLIGLVIVVVGIVSGGGSSSASNSSSTSNLTPAVQTTTPAPQTDTVRQSVANFSAILDDAAAGREAASSGDWQSAIDNRQRVLGELSNAQFDTRLLGYAQLLAKALNYSLQADEAHSLCDPAVACPDGERYDSLATATKQQFLAGFNQLSSQYGGRQYSEADF